MENKEGYLEFVTSESYKQQIDVWYRAYNISREKTELFYDFVSSLYDLMEETYMGADIMSSQEDQKNHFTWCWDKILKNFELERIYFKERDSAYQYLWNFFVEAYYYNKLDDNPNRISDYFYILFDFDHRKSRSELDMLTEIYKLFDQNLKK